MQYNHFYNMRVPPTAIKYNINNNQYIQSNKLYNSDNTNQQLNPSHHQKQNQKQSNQKFNHIPYTIDKNNVTQSIIFNTNHNKNNIISNNHNKRFIFQNTKKHNNINNQTNINQNNYGQINNINAQTINNIQKNTYKNIQKNNLNNIQKNTDKNQIQRNKSHSIYNHNFKKQLNQKDQTKNLKLSCIITQDNKMARMSFYKKYKSPQNIKLDNRSYFSSNSQTTSLSLKESIIPTNLLKDSITYKTSPKLSNQSNFNNNSTDSPLSPKMSNKIIQDLNNKGYNRKYSQDQKQKDNINLKNNQHNQQNNQSVTKSNQQINIINKKQDQKSTINTQDKNSIKLPKFLQKNIQNHIKQSFISPNVSKQKLKIKNITNISSSSSENNDLNFNSILSNNIKQHKTFTSTIQSYKEPYNNNLAKPTNMFSKKKMIQCTSSSFAKTTNTPQNPPTKVDYPNFQFGRLSSPSSFNNRKKIQSSNNKQFCLRDFEIVNKLGKGAFGDVYLVKQIALGFLCVLKKVSKKRIKQQKIQQNILRQIKIQSYLKHKHLTQIFGYFDDQQYLYLILQLLPDGPLNYAKKKKKVPENQTSKYIKQICQGLRYMHKQDIIHRDLKPQNIFLYQDYLKIGDFGCAVFTQTLRRTIVGCLAYISPQQLNNQFYDDKIDVWCIGILTYQLITGRAPFQADIAKISRQHIQLKLPQLKFPDDITISQHCRDFIKRLLQTNPQDRMTIQQALKHSFITKTLQTDRKQQQQIYGMYQSL